jgi:hypothetical protein
MLTRGLLVGPLISKSMAESHHNRCEDINLYTQKVVPRTVRNVPLFRGFHVFCLNMRVGEVGVVKWVLTWRDTFPLRWSFGWAQCNAKIEDGVFLNYYRVPRPSWYQAPEVR